MPVSWSPDAERLLVREEGRRTISSFRLSDEKQVESLVAREGHRLDSAAYSADGSWVAFTETRGPGWRGQASAVVVAPIDREGLIDDSSRVTITDRQGSDALPRWSPDGQSL